MTTDSLMVSLTVVLAVLTLIIVGLTLVMVFLVYKQLRGQNASEARSRDRDISKVKISANRYRMGPTFSSDLVALTVANGGLVDVEIHSFAFEVGALRTGSPGIPTAEIHLKPETPDHGPAVTMMSLPHRLRPAESFSVFFDRNRLVEESVKLGGGEPVHLRPFCHDSLGHKYTMDRWIAYMPDNHTSLAFSPSADRISEEDLAKLCPEEQRLYGNWGATYIAPRSR